MQTEQVPGHLYGPARPLIAFFYGECYLGEVCGHPSDIQAAQTKLLQMLDVIEPGDPAGKRGRILCASHVKVYCGQQWTEYPFRDHTSALWNSVERSRQMRTHGRIIH